MLQFKINFIDFEWKPYNGFIPKDAIKCGLNYIGQVPFPLSNGILPGTIRPGARSILVTAYAVELNIESDVKVQKIQKI